MFCKSACSVLWRISQTFKWHIRQAQVRSSASGPKTVFLIHLKYKSRSHYALLHSSYLATPIHKMPYKAQCSIGLMCWDSVQRTFKGTQRKTAYHCFSSALWWFYTKKEQKRLSFFLMGQPVTTGNHFQSIYTDLQSCWSHLNTKLTSNPMNSMCRLPSACVSVVGPLLCLSPIQFPPWAQTKTWSLYPPNTEQIQRLTLQTVAGTARKASF